MKALKITLLVAVFCLTFSGISSDTEVKPTNTLDQVNTYKQINKESILIAGVIKNKKDKPGNNM